MEIVKALLLIGALLFIALYDQKTHEILLLSLVPIVIAGFIEMEGILPAVLGAGAVSLPMLLISRLDPGGIGRGDVYLMAAAGFVLGPQKVVFATVCGLSLFLLYYAAVKRRKDIPYAMAPWLGAGAVIAFFM